MKKTITLLVILTIIFLCKNRKGYMEQNLANFKIIGISFESTSEGGKAIEDMGKLWGQFYSNGISDKIPNKGR